MSHPFSITGTSPAQTSDPFDLQGFATPFEDSEPSTQNEWQNAHSLSLTHFNSSSKHSPSLSSVFENTNSSSTISTSSSTLPTDSIDRPKVKADALTLHYSSSSLPFDASSSKSSRESTGSRSLPADFFLPPPDQTSHLQVLTSPNESGTDFAVESITPAQLLSTSSSSSPYPFVFPNGQSNMASIAETPSSTKNNSSSYSALYSSSSSSLSSDSHFLQNWSSNYDRSSSNSALHSSPINLPTPIGLGKDSPHRQSLKEKNLFVYPDAYDANDADKITSPLPFFSEPTPTAFAVYTQPPKVLVAVKTDLIGYREEIAAERWLYDNSGRGWALLHVFEGLLKIICESAAWVFAKIAAFFACSMERSSDDHADVLNAHVNGLIVSLHAVWSPNEAKESKTAKSLGCPLSKWKWGKIYTGERTTYSLECTCFDWKKV